MSDNNAESFADRSDDEIKALGEQFQAQGYAGRTYTAPPAKGSDTKGLWHSFSAHGRSGYSAHAVALHCMLLDHFKIPTSLIPHRHQAIDIDQFPEDRNEMLMKWLVDAVGISEALIVSAPPELIMYDMSRALVNYVAGPECTSVSPYAANLVSRDDADAECMTALWCVSPFTARAYLTGGASPKKVFVVRPPICDGIWRDMFLPLDQIQPRTRSADKPFVFGTLGTWQERKGFFDLIRAYFKSFGRDQNVELHIRTSSLEDHVTIKTFEAKVIADIAKIAKEEFGDDNYPASRVQPRIKLLTGTGLSEKEVVKWLGTLDCYVNPSYGEGLGIPQMWAFAQGVPVLTSDFGAVGEFALLLGEERCSTFKSTLTRVPPTMRAHSPIWGGQSQWGQYDPSFLGEEMYEVFARGSFLHSADVAAFTRGHFSYAQCAEGARTALEAVCRPEIMAEWAEKALR